MSVDITLDNVSNLLNQFRSLTESLENSEVDAFQEGFSRLKESFWQKEQQAILEEKRNAPLFNVFMILGLSRYEVRTHSTMLAYLLDPSERHGQQFLFLEAFCNYCREIYPAFPGFVNNIQSGHWQVTREKDIQPYGKIDILLSCLNLNFICVIENKIDAPEQPYQIHRYGKWLVEQRKDFTAQALVYLTVDGGKATTALGFPCYPLSYQTDIANWLSRLISRIEAPNVREVVTQYCALVQNL
jgi:hypothetical protein